MVGEMFCPLHLVIGKMDSLDISEEITPVDEITEFPSLPIMANISIPIRVRKVKNKVREKMRIDEALDHITHREFVKFEQICADFQQVEDKYRADKDYIFPEENFIR